MSIPQKKFRELVVQLLFAMEIGAIDEKEIYPLLLKEIKITKKEATQAIMEMKRVWERKNEIDLLISKISESYQINRIQKMDLSILREAVYEMLYEKIDPKIVISEAIRLCRKFSTPEAGAFVNALLDAIHRTQPNADPSSL